MSRYFSVALSQLFGSASVSRGELWMMRRLRVFDRFSQSECHLHAHQVAAVLILCLDPTGEFATGSAALYVDVDLQAHLARGGGAGEAVHVDVTCAQGQVELVLAASAAR